MNYEIRSGPDPFQGYSRRLDPDLVSLDVGSGSTAPGSATLVLTESYNFVRNLKIYCFSKIHFIETVKS